jgi:hypothetical protein
MRAFVTLLCSLALICAAYADKQQTKSTTQAKTSQHVGATKAPQHVATHSNTPAVNNAHVQHAQAPQHVAPPVGNTARVQPGMRGPQTAQPVQPRFQGGGQQRAAAVQPPAPPLTKEQQAQVNAQDQGFRSHEQYRKWKETGRVETPGGAATTRAPVGQHGGTAGGSGAPASHKGVHQFPSRHFNLPNTPLPVAQHVKFQSASHIPGCENWRDSRYNAFRKYAATWHDADWWRNHCSRIVFVLGGWYYWHAGYWYPAWGYSSEAAYPYDGPIYAYNNLEPDQVVANVQATLQELGYYPGAINGVLDLPTRAALADYQRDHGLYTTSAIDEPTLAALGMA